jgi:hypothetical protein
MKTGFIIGSLVWSLLGLAPTNYHNDDCSQATRYELVATTTLKNTTTARAAKLSCNPSVISVETDTAWLNICVQNDGKCQWKVEQKSLEKGKVRYSPVGLYVIAALRQSAGDWTASPESIVEQVKRDGAKIEGLGNHTISIKTENPSNGQYGVTLMDTTRCVFLGSSLFEKEGNLKYKAVYHYENNDATHQRELVSATLLIFDPEKNQISETVTRFKKM